MIEDKLGMCSGSLGERLAEIPVMDLELQEGFALDLKIWHEE